MAMIVLSEFAGFGDNGGLNIEGEKKEKEK
jgi:hypothetical protein